MKRAWILACAAALMLWLPGRPLGAHEHHPPHHGSLQVFGHEMAHVELVLDKDSGKLTAYALDGEAESAVRLKQGTLRITVLRTGREKGGPGAKAHFDVVLKAVANPLTGETVGDSSQFEAVSARLKGLAFFEGRSGPVTIRGIRFETNTIKYPEGNE